MVKGVGTDTIDLLDRKIIQALYLDPRGSFSRLSEVLGPSEQTIARRYRRLVHSRVVRVVGELNSQRLGRSDWAVRIRCAPGSATAVATRLAEHPDTAWVQLVSGGVEIFSTISARGHGARTPLLLSQLSVGRHVLALEAYCLLHVFSVGASPPPGPSHLSPEEIDRLSAPRRETTWTDPPNVDLQDTDWPLVQALAEDGRASYRQLAMRTHWHESTVRRRVEELVDSGVLSFDVDLASGALGFNSRALLWISVAPSELTAVGRALAARPEVPFVAATTGSTNLVAVLVCRDDRELFEFITGEMATLDGLAHIETAPVMRAVKMHVTIAPPEP
jgi:DNA-binding Lrp family transcriptional regulator